MEYIIWLIPFNSGIRQMLITCIPSTRFEEVLLAKLSMTVRRSVLASRYHALLIAHMMRIIFLQKLSVIFRNFSIISQHSFVTRITIFLNLSKSSSVFRDFGLNSRLRSFVNQSKVGLRPETE